MTVADLTLICFILIVGVWRLNDLAHEVAIARLALERIADFLEGSDDDPGPPADAKRPELREAA